MSISKPNIFTLSVRLPRPYSLLAEISVFNEEDVKQAPSQVGEDNISLIHYHLPKGLYRLRIVMNGYVKDKVTLINSNCTYHVDYEDMYSLWSPTPTVAKSLMDVQADALSRFQHRYGLEPSILLLYFSYAPMESGKKIQKTDFPVYNRDFFIWNEELEKAKEISVSVVDESGYETNAIAVEIYGLACGLYFLQLNQDSRLIPFHIIRSGVTLCYMMIRAQFQILFGTLRLYYSNNGFGSGLHTFQFVDLLTVKLLNRDVSKNEVLLRYACKGSSSFLEKLLICYLYLFAKSESANLLINRMLVELRNVEGFDHFSTDLTVIDLYLKHQTGEGVATSQRPFTQMPLIQVGFQCLQELAISYPWLISAYSLNDYASEGIYYDTPYTTFKAPAALSSDAKLYILSGETSLSHGFPLKGELLSDGLSIFPGQRKESNWVLYGLYELYQADRKTTVQRASEVLDLPINTIKRVLSKEKHEIKLDRKRMIKGSTIVLLIAATLFIIVNPEIYTLIGHWKLNTTDNQFPISKNGGKIVEYGSTDSAVKTTTSPPVSLGVDHVDKFKPEEQMIDSSGAWVHEGEGGPEWMNGISDGDLEFFTERFKDSLVAKNLQDSELLKYYKGIPGEVDIPKFERIESVRNFLLKKADLSDTLLGKYLHLSEFSLQYHKNFIENKNVKQDPFFHLLDSLSRARPSMKLPDETKKLLGQYQSFSGRE